MKTFEYHFFQKDTHLYEYNIKKNNFVYVWEDTVWLQVEHRNGLKMATFFV